MERKEHEIGKKEEKENLSSEHGSTDHHSPLSSRELLNTNNKCIWHKTVFLSQMKEFPKL